MGESKDDSDAEKVLEEFVATAERSEEVKTIRISELSASHFGKTVKFQAIVAGVEPNKAMPRSVTVSCNVCGTKSYELADPKNWRVLSSYLFRRNSITRDLTQEHKGHIKDVNIDYSSDMLDYFGAYLLPILQHEKFTSTTYRPVKAYVIGMPNIEETAIEAEGVVTIDAHNNLTVLVYKVKPLVERWNIKITEEDEAKFRQYFRADNIEDALDKTIAPHIVGRKDAKFALALCLHSPLEIRFRGRLIYGTMNVMFLGDTTTGKSEIIFSPKLDFDIGQAAVCEISRVTGLMATVDLNTQTIIWGVIPLSDKEHIALDGLQRVSPDDLAMMREALRTKRVEVLKAVKGCAPCRTRITAAANPNKPMNEYSYLCEAIKDCRPFESPIDITRWDLFIPFSQEDVPKEEIARAKKTPPYIPKEVFAKHVFWAWNLKAEDIVFTEEAEEEIERAYLELRQYSLPDLPLIGDDLMVKLAKMSAANAILTHSMVSYCLPLYQLELGEGGRAERSKSMVSQSLTVAEGKEDMVYYCLPAGNGERGRALTETKEVPAGGTPSPGTGKVVNSRKLAVEHSGVVNRSKVVVGKEHVAKVVDFLRRVLEKWEFFEYFDFVRRIKTLSRGEALAIKQALDADPLARRIFEEIAKRQGIEREELAQKLGISEPWISNKVNVLKKLELVESRKGRRGYWLSPKGVAYVRYLAAEEKRKVLLERLIERLDEATERGTKELGKKDYEAIVLGVTEGDVKMAVELTRKLAKEGVLRYNKDRGTVTFIPPKAPIG